jgi:predicted O-methyltransferase YrrM
MTSTFTADLFTDHIDNWNKHVVPHLQGVPNVRWLEVGSYEGRSALWTLDHILTGENSTLVCVDSWGPLWLTPSTTEARFDENLADRRNVVKIKGASRDVLSTLPKCSFHGAYVDGSHAEDDAYQDACQVLPLLRPGALLVFDDYEGDLPPGKPQQFGVRQAVDRFLGEHRAEFRVLHRGWQAILQRRGEKVSSAPEECACGEMEICSACLGTRARPCPGLPGKWTCRRTNTPPGEIAKYGHCMVCESLAEAERRFRMVEAACQKDHRLNTLPMPGYVTQGDAALILALLDNQVASA